MTLPVWPWRLLLPASQKTRLVNQAISGGISIAGMTQTIVSSGGGHWVSDLSGINLQTPDQIRCARAWSALLDAGATSLVLPFWDLAQAPRPTIGGVAVKPSLPAITASDYFNNPVGFTTALMSSTCIGAVALRATSMVINIATGSALCGGEYFSINHAGCGWRLYRIAQVTAVSGSQYTCTIRPPLREAIATGTALEFDVPRCTMKLVAGRSDSLDPDVGLGRFGKVDVAFEEAF